MAQKSIAYYTLGCKLNFTETSAIARQFDAAGYERVAFEDRADVYIINTCSVTDNADKKCRNIIRQAKRVSPNSRVVVVGCYAQLKPGEISEMEGVDLVLGAGEKFNVLAHLKGLDQGDYANYIAGDIQDVNFYRSAWSEGERTRTFLKVQDGCDYGCAFCTIPLARGMSRSDTIENVVKTAREIAATDVNEIVLTGVNIGDFGKGNQGARKAEESFFDLIQQLDKVEGIERFRISSIEPNLLHPEIIEFVATSNRFMPHFHIPLQSGSDEILNRMRRRYLSGLYAERVEKIKSIMPHCAIGVDVIVGFPGETEKHFMETYDFLNQLDVSYLHVFTYSERKNTLAVEMDGVVDVGERRKRSEMLRSLSHKKRMTFYDRYLNETRKVLFEEDDKNGMMHGFTDNYVKVAYPFDENFVNKIKACRLKTISERGTVEVDVLAMQNLKRLK